MTEQQRLWSDKGFLKALEAESERRARLKELTARAIQERKELETIERNITVSSLGNSAFDQGVEAMARKRITVEQLDRLCRTLESQQVAVLAGIGQAKANFFEGELRAMDVELARLKQAAAPHLAALEKLEGVAFIPSNPVGVPMLEGGHWYALFSKTAKLKQQLAGLVDRIAPIKDNPANAGDHLYAQWMESRTGEGSVNASSLMAAGAILSGFGG